MKPQPPNPTGHTQHTSRYEVPRTILVVPGDTVTLQTTGVNTSQPDVAGSPVAITFANGASTFVEGLAAMMPLSVPTNIDGVRARQIRRWPAHLSSYARLHEFFCQLDTNHPWRYSLVPARISDPATPPGALSWHAGAWRRLDDLLPHLDPNVTNDSIGWFAPNADPEIFGTPFLYPSRIQGKGKNTRVGWALQQVGIPGKVSSKLWSDAEGLATLADLAANPDAESLATRREDSVRLEDVEAIRRFQERRSDARWQGRRLNGLSDVSTFRIHRP